MDNTFEVLLLRGFAEERSITRPEVGILLNRTVGQMAGLHHRNVKKIGTWPRLEKVRVKNRKCQFPIVVTNEAFELCGNERNKNRLVCDTHIGKIWQAPACEEVPEKESA